MKTKLSDESRVQDVALENVDGVDYLYFVDAETKQTFRLPLATLLAWLGQELDVDSSAIASPDASVSLTATDDGLVLVGAEDLVAPTYGLGMDDDGNVGRVELGAGLEDVEAELGELDERLDDVEDELASLASFDSLYALKPAADAVGTGGTIAGDASGFIASATLRLNAIPAGSETVAGNRPGAGTTGGWGIGVNASGFVAVAARESDGALQASTPTGLLAFTSYTTAELLTRVFVISIRVTATEMRVFVDDVFAQAVPLTGGYRPATTTRFALHRNSDIGPGGPVDHASASEVVAAYYVDPVINALGGYTDAHVATLFANAVNNDGVYAGISGIGCRYAVNPMTDGSPYSYIGDTGGAGQPTLFVVGTAPHRGRGLAPRLWEIGATVHAQRTDNPHGVTAAQVNALPRPGGTTTANGIVTDSGGTGSAVAVSTTTIADLVKRLGNVFTLSANTVLDDSYSGSVIFTDTSGGARQHTVPTTVSAGWNAVFVREGANTLKVIGDGTMLMKGPAAAANEVAIAVDDGGVSVIRRSATKCWCAGKIS